MSEEWRSIPEHPDYEVSDLGRVKSRRVDPSGRLLKPRAIKPSRKGNLPYLRVALYSDIGRVDVSIHQLVLGVFVGPRPSGLEACHNNGDCQDNRLTNLRWDTPGANSKDRVLHRSECQSGHKLEGRNLMMASNGVRQVRRCRTCHNQRTLARYHAAK